ncbi:MAG: hypothetical protein Q8Q40_04845 [Methylococcaceae bacterium]|nr:hypothetical protein [Methylococcaceae bacterium]MDP3903281.1 hypothetical protein [Methylococcaceae bacterium]
MESNFNIASASNKARYIFSVFAQRTRWFGSVPAGIINSPELFGNTYLGAVGKFNSISTINNGLELNALFEADNKGNFEKSIPAMVRQALSRNSFFMLKKSTIYKRAIKLKNASNSVCFLVTSCRRKGGLTLPSTNGTP